MSAVRVAVTAAADRRLSLAGYEVYRFSGAELSDPDLARALLDEFFTALLDDLAVRA